MFEKTALQLVIVGGNSIGDKGVGADRRSGSSTIGRARRCWDLLRGTRRDTELMRERRALLAAVAWEGEAGEVGLAG
jgi:hypothetical protein